MRSDDRRSGRIRSSDAAAEAATNAGDATGVRRGVRLGGADRRHLLRQQLHLLSVLMMSDARRGMIWLAILAAVIIAGDHLLAIALGQVLVRSQFRFSRLYRGGNDADIIVLGDSRGVHSFYAPALEELTGLRVF